MNILILEDDPMVEFIHRNYIEKTALFQNIYSTNSIIEAQQIIEQKECDLLLLDIHLIDGNGMDLLETIRKHKLSIEVIVISAASEAVTVKKGLYLGVVDYLVKPFTYERFHQSMQLFITRKELFDHECVEQEMIDELKLNNTVDDSIRTFTEMNQLTKGLSNETLRRIETIISTIDNSFTIQDLSKESGLSHVSIRKYIAYLEENKKIYSEVIYTKVGRPYKVFFNIQL